MKGLTYIDPLTIYPPDFLEWIALSPAERVVQSGEMWDIYMAYGGSFEADLDPQSPFFDPEKQSAGTTNGGAGLRIIRRC